jgi:hypothetical protein
MSKGMYGNGDAEFIRAAFEEWQTSEASYRVKWECDISPAGRWGVLIGKVCVFDTLREGRASPVVSCALEWPNSQPQAFGAFLYGLCHRVARQVEAWALEDARARSGISRA